MSYKAARRIDFDKLPERRKQALAAMMAAPELSNPEAERQVLGLLLMNNSIIYDLDLKPEHFFEPVHQRIFDAIWTAVSDGRTVDPIALKNQFDADDSLADIGGWQYLVKLVSAASAIGLPIEYARVIRDMYNRRKYAWTMEKALLKFMSFDKDHSTPAVVSELLQMLMEASDESGTTKIVDMDSVTDEIIKDIENKVEPTSTGIKRIDDAMLGGFHRAQTYCWVSTQKGGKTTLMSSLFANQAKAGHKVMYIAAEMGRKDIHKRNLARQIGENSMSFFNKKEDPEFISKLVQQQTTGKQSKSSGMYADCPGLTFAELQQIVAVAAVRRGCVGIYLDYLGLVRSPYGPEREAFFMAEVAQWLAAAAKKFNIWICYAQQTNRQGDIRGSDGPKMAADAVYEVSVDFEAGEGWIKALYVRHFLKQDIGSAKKPALLYNRKGPFLEDMPDDYNKKEEPCEYSAYDGNPLAD